MYVLTSYVHAYIHISSLEISSYIHAISLYVYNRVL